MNDIEDSQFEPPPPIPRGVSPGAKKFHLYRLIIGLYEQLAVLRVTAHTHTTAESIEGAHFQSLPPIPQAAEVVRLDELLRRQVISLHEQVASLRVAAHEHISAEVPRGRDPWIMGAVRPASDDEGKQFKAPSPFPVGASRGDRDEHLYREIVRLYEQLAAVRAAAHLHTAIGVEHPR